MAKVRKNGVFEFLQREGERRGRLNIVTIQLRARLGPAARPYVRRAREASSRRLLRVAIRLTELFAVKRFVLMTKLDRLLPNAPPGRDV